MKTIKVQKINPDGTPAVNADGTPVIIEVPDPTEARQAISQAELLRVRESDLERQLAERETALRQERAARQAALPEGERFQAQLSETQSQLAQERAARLQFEAQANANLRAMGLTAYRERAAQEVQHPALRDLIGGGDEQAIDASVTAANAAFERLQADLAAQFRAGQAHAQQASAQSAAIPANAVPIPVPNPAYVPPVPPHALQMGGFPQATNPLPVTEQTNPVGAILGGNIEQAVRTGQYSGDVRQRALRQVQGVQYTGPSNSMPRHLRQAQHQPMPGGVMQPVAAPPIGAPVGVPQYQAVHHGMAAPQQYAQPYQMPAPMPVGPQGYPVGVIPSAPPSMNPAAEAAARTHAGQSPVLNQNPGAADALRAAQQYGAAHGVTPQVAHQQRFSN